MPGPFRKCKEKVGHRIVWRDVSRLALETAAEPPTDGNVYADPSVETPEHAKGPRNTQVARGGGVACVQDPWAHQHWNVDARRMGQGAGVVDAGMAR